MFTLIAQYPDFIVINKSPDVSVHKDQSEQALLAEVEKQLGIDKLFLVHRLDKMTSGLLVLATSSQACAELASQFANRQVEKYYLAISDAKPKKKQGLIAGDMQKSRRSAWKLLKSQTEPAVTQFFSSFAGEGVRLFLCKPYTGKTHQIRVALKSLGSAIVGDPIYHSNAQQHDRGYLHAFSIAFTFLGQKYQFVCDPRDYSDFGKLWHHADVSNGIEQWLEPQALNWPTLPSSIKHACISQ